MESVPEVVCSFVQSLKVRLRINQRVTECMSNLQEPRVPDECPKVRTSPFVRTVTVIFFPLQMFETAGFLSHLDSRQETLSNVSMCFHKEESERMFPAGENAP